MFEPGVDLVRNPVTLFLSANVVLSRLASIWMFSFNPCAATMFFCIWNALRVDAKNNLPRYKSILYHVTTQRVWLAGCKPEIFV